MASAHRILSAPVTIRFTPPGGLLFAGVRVDYQIINPGIEGSPFPPVVGVAHTCTPATSVFNLRPLANSQFRMVVPGDYAARQTCEWTVAVPDAQMITLTAYPYDAETNGDLFTCFDSAGDVAVFLTGKTKANTRFTLRRNRSPYRCLFSSDALNEQGKVHGGVEVLASCVTETNAPPPPRVDFDAAPCTPNRMFGGRNIECEPGMTNYLDMTDQVVPGYMLPPVSFNLLINFAEYDYRDCTIVVKGELPKYAIMMRPYCSRVSR